MLPSLTPEFAQRLHDWIVSSLAGGANVFSAGYQGTILYYDDGTVRLVVKVPPLVTWKRLLLLPLLRHEYRVYQKLADIPGIPRCYGLLADRFLILEYIEGASLRDGRIGDREQFFTGLRSLLGRVHAAGVAHADLKKKDNILIAADGRPYLVDFGIACIRKPGFAPFNHWLFEMGRRFDFNAWVKHKYQRRFVDISTEDRAYLRPTLIERLARLIKQPYRAVRRRLRRFFSH
ncbi:MAG TPA: hypothetical protein VGL10_07840 [Gammaproteobacteria bacterium]